jgi:hypothetical protein
VKFFLNTWVGLAGIENFAVFSTGFSKWVQIIENY